MSNHSTQLHRRKALQGIVGAGSVAGLVAAPDKWVKPVVDSVILPAHAQTTGVSEFCEITNIVAENKSGPIELNQGEKIQVLVDVTVIDPNGNNALVIVALRSPSANAVNYLLIEGKEINANGRSVVKFHIGSCSNGCVFKEIDLKYLDVNVRILGSFICHKQTRQVDYFVRGDVIENTTNA